jgi:carbonic anhydrase/acetyltransferase-like protein (isoleucine patch superfamily)
VVIVNKIIIAGGFAIASEIEGKHFGLMNFDEQMARHLDATPAIHPTAFIAPGAVIVGDVEIGEEASVWYGAVLRGDLNRIRIGPRSNIQDGSVVHLADELGVHVGQYVTCGHNAILHACSVDDEVLIGMGATVLDGAEIGARSVIGANALVTQGMKIPPGSLVLGAPGKVRRMLDLEEQEGVRYWAEKYVRLSRASMGRGRAGG